jgi:hypothetical protein
VANFTCPSRGRNISYPSLKALELSLKGKLEIGYLILGS